MGRAWVSRAVFLAVAVWLVLPGVLVSDTALVARASEVVLPCAGPALRAARVTGVRVIPGEVRESGAADILIGGSVEINRALESGLAYVDSDQSVGEVEWRLVTGDDHASRSLSQAGEVAAEIAVPTGADAAEVRRAVARTGARVQERPMKSVRDAPLAVVPSWASPEGGTEIDVRPLRVRAAVSRSARDAAAARAAVEALGSEAARRAFARCAGAP
jgi:hypothetical protein